MTMSNKQGSGGGGFGSRVHVSKPMRQGAPRERANKTGTAQLGQRQGDHITEHGSTGYGGVPIFDGGAAFPGGRLGNEVAETTKCGPGGSRTIYKSGQQQGLVDRPMPQGKEIFPGFSGKGKG